MCVPNVPSSDLPSLGSWGSFGLRVLQVLDMFFLVHIYIYTVIVELRTPAMPVGVERGGFHLNLRT